MKRILIIGANGFLGRTLLSKFVQENDLQIELFAADIDISYISNTNSKCTTQVLDITEKDLVDQYIEKIQPDIVYLTAAMTNVDACEDFIDKANMINAEAPMFVANAVKKIGGKLIHISTDFVFDGEFGNYSEADEPNPISEYGKSKLKGEQNIIDSGADYVICRTSVIYGWPQEGVHQNFFSWAYGVAEQNKSLTIIKGQITNPTLVEDLANFLFQLSIKGDTIHRQIFHTVGPESLSRFDFVSKMIKIFNFNSDLLSGVDSFSQKAKRPDNSSLNTMKIQELNISTFKNIEESMIFLKYQKVKSEKI